MNTLQVHLRKHHPSAQQNRVTFQAENVELTNLVSVQDLARKLLSSSLKQIDAIICNAGIGGWTGLDWFAAIPVIIADIRNNTVWPAFKLGMVGSLTRPQLPQKAAQSESLLGEVFCANVFGHYMLVHWLMPLLRVGNINNPSKIIWVSSIEPQNYHFKEMDLQGLLTDAPYEHGKRLTDILSLTSNQPTTAESVSSFTSPASSLTMTSKLPDRKDNGPPAMHVYHPGIVVTSVISLYWIIQQAYLLGIYLARWVGSPWSTVQPFTAAHGATWLALASNNEIQQAEIDVHPVKGSDSKIAVEKGKVKWGTAINRSGKTTVRATEVDKWGLRGTGEPYARDWWGGLYGKGGKYGRGRKPDAVEAKPEDVQEFLAQGARVWKQMEQLRRDWERRLKDYEDSAP